MTFKQWVEGLTCKVFTPWQLLGIFFAFELMYFEIFWLAGFSPLNALFYAGCFTSLSINSLIDLRRKLLIVFWSNLAFLNVLFILGTAIAENSLLFSNEIAVAFCGIGIVILIFWFFLPANLGRGDLRIILILHLLSPLYQWWLIFLILGIAAGLVLIVQIMMRIFRKKTLLSFPFAPFLVIAAVSSVLLLPR